MTQTNIKVVVRFRPRLSFEEEECWLTSQNQGTISSMVSERLAAKIQSKFNRKVGEESLNQLSYEYDTIATAQTSSQQLYRSQCSKIVAESLNGINGTICAYGQTCSGKTHSINGTQKAPGILPCALKHIFQEITRSQLVFRVFVSYIQIYNETILDLLQPTKNPNLKIQDDEKWGVEVQATKTVVMNYGDSIGVLSQGQANRTYKKKLNHDHSSRSHTVFRIYIQSYNDTLVKSKAVHRYSVLNVVDLAGSERMSKTLDNTTLQTGSINKSLFMLSNVINKLVQNQLHIPYRDSKLTRILENSLGGNSSTLILCCVSPSVSCFQQTVSTLRFANQVKKVKNTKTQNKQEGEVYHLHAMIKQLQATCEKLDSKYKALRNQYQQLQVQHQVLKRDKSKQKKVVRERERQAILYIDDYDTNLLWLDPNGHLGRQGVDQCIQKYKLAKSTLYMEFVEQLLGHTRFKVREVNTVLLGRGTQQLMKMFTTCRMESLLSLDSITLQQKKTIGNYYREILSQVGGFAGRIKKFGLCLWGSNKDCRLSKAKQTSTSPFQLDLRIDQISLGAHHNLALTDGSVLGWGKNTYKQAGYYSDEEQQQKGCISVPRTISFPCKILEVAAGWGHSLILDSNGRVYSWGFGQDGQLGHDTFGNLDTPTAIQCSKNIKHIYAGHSHSAYIDQHNSLYTFGCNVDLRLMREGDQSTPGICFRKVQQVSLGVTHSCLITQSEELFGGGDGSYGQLGPLDSTITVTSFPKSKRFDEDSSARCCQIKQVQYFDENRRPRRVSCGENFTLVLDSKGNVYSFGRGAYYRLGNGKLANLYDPHLIPNLKSISKISAGSRHCLALTTQGQLYGWGFNLYKQSHPQSDQDVRIPILITQFQDTKIRDIYTGYFHSGFLYQKQ